MWLIIDRGTQRVFATEGQYPPEGAYNEEIFEIKEWDGATPQLPIFDMEGHRIPGDLDPTLTDPGYEEKVRQRLDFEELADKAAAEVDWLEATIPLIDTMTLEELRAMLKRLAQENLETIKAWRYVLRRLA